MTSQNPIYIQQNEKGLFLDIKVTPNAKKSALDNVWNNTHLKIALHAQAVDGKANQALIDFLSDFLNIKKGSITLVKGDKSRLKKVFVTLDNTENVTQILNKLP